MGKVACTGVLSDGNGPPQKSPSPLLTTRDNDGRGDRIRTCDILLPKQARYQAALLPDSVCSLIIGRGLVEKKAQRLIPAALGGGYGIHFEG